MKVNKIVIVVFSFIVFLNLYAQEEAFECDSAFIEPYKGVDQRGGRYLTETGVLKILVIFVQFVDDVSNPNSQVWPIGQPPAYMNDVVDSNLIEQSTNGNLSHYFRTMSLDNLQIIGDSYFVITDLPKQWYLTNGYRFGKINKDMLTKLDPQIDYSIYDNWTFGNYLHLNQPDTIVDLIIMIHREDLPSTLHPGNGVASLGFGQPNLELDNGNILVIGNGVASSGMSI